MLPGAEPGPRHKVLVLRRGVRAALRNAELGPGHWGLVRLREGKAVSEQNGSPIIWDAGR